MSVFAEFQIKNSRVRSDAHDFRTPAGLVIYPISFSGIGR